MQYSVSAQPRHAELPYLWKLLNDGTISGQEPDGVEIIASMKRAVIKNDTVSWYETCYCNPPLKHERSTVYDQFFHNMAVEPLSNPPTLDGELFWDYLRERAKGTNDEAVAEATPEFRYVPIRTL